MTDLIKIAVDAMGGDNSPNKIIDGVIHNHKSSKNVLYQIFGDENKITNLINDKIDKVVYFLQSSLKSVAMVCVFLEHPENNCHIIFHICLTNFFKLFILHVLS